MTHHPKRSTHRSVQNSPSTASRGPSVPSHRPLATQRSSFSSLTLDLEKSDFFKDPSHHLPPRRSWVMSHRPILASPRNGVEARRLHRCQRRHHELIPRSHCQRFRALVLRSTKAMPTPRPIMCPDSRILLERPPTSLQTEEGRLPRVSCHADGPTYSMVELAGQHTLSRRQHLRRASPHLESAPSSREDHHIPLTGASPAVRWATNPSPFPTPTNSRAKSRRSVQGALTTHAALFTARVPLLPYDPCVSGRATAENDDTAFVPWLRFRAIFASCPHLF